ncbi:MAG: ATP-binding cassette domain-containing protein [Thermanaeromonas sp.]|uniref:ATP-binding cassette domain-containing protein n=1 Tax=Thermanaeromonas sp. TaxID=2003697 RepID=UPI0024408604|nr:ATP-binding cassette domain-containing protein [Thermanaeromonas sp.]MCG0277496.1 ATP-binding cassette domain-containing protein [Thermanaeromonas sp.]
MEQVIVVDDLHFKYPDGTWALRGLSFTVTRGKKVALMGHNGAGKSTLLWHLNGLFLPQQGEVRIEGRLITSSTEKWVRTRVGLVFQDPDDQVFSATVKEDVAFGPRNLGLPPGEVEKRVRSALAAVGMLGYQNHPPQSLSYGQKKRIAIAGVLAMEPEIILLDEPLAFLDPAAQENLCLLLEELHRQGKSLLVATHDVDFAASWAEEVLILKEGKLLAHGDPELLLNEDMVREAGLRLPIVAQIFRGLLPEGFTLPRDVQGARRILQAFLK